MNERHLLWVATGAVAGIAGALLARRALLRLPADFLRRGERTRGSRVARTLFGLALLALGGALLVLPGPGVLLIVFALTLIEFPGRMRLVRWLLGRTRALGAINAMRRRRGLPPLEPPEHEP